MFKIRELKQENDRLRNLADAHKADIERLEAEKQGELIRYKERLQEEIMASQRLHEQQRDAEMEKYKQHLELEYQKRVTEYQEKFFNEMKKLFTEELVVLKDTYNELIKSMI